MLPADNIKIKNGVKYILNGGKFTGDFSPLFPTKAEVENWTKANKASKAKANFIFHLFKTKQNKKKTF